MNRKVEFIEKDRYSLICMDDGKANAIEVDFSLAQQAVDG